MTTSPATIVIADDDDDIRRLVGFTLSRRGYRIVEANNGEAALETIRLERPSLAVLDVMMPGLSGIDVIHKLREEDDTARIPVLLVSASGQGNEIAHGIQSGADDYLVKPFRPRDLVAKVEFLLANGARR
jgi:DNA-binding response OmpR family regulator